MKLHVRARGVRTEVIASPGSLYIGMAPGYTVPAGGWRLARCSSRPTTSWRGSGGQARGGLQGDASLAPTRHLSACVFLFSAGFVGNGRKHRRSIIMPSVASSNRLVRSCQVDFLELLTS